MALDPIQLATTMLSAALGVLKKKTPEIQQYAETEFKKIAETIATIAKMVAAGQMGEEEAKLHLQIQASASRAVLLCVEGLGLLAAEAAINAALASVKDLVNAALPFKLL
jgi:signal transduction protein with GAF and PtsI domain